MGTRLKSVVKTFEALQGEVIEALYDDRFLDFTFKYAECCALLDMVAITYGASNPDVKYMYNLGTDLIIELSIWHENNG